ncbi:MAG: LysR family transcriptional regulator [Thiothrix sp.]|nr:LysR family transcriptional regulator [Thiothrix sp.]HPQ94006.1 LysR family transcriptional regulator [Thiolinea sp.]
MVHYSLRQLRYFITAAELKSTSAAARQLHVSQPSISTAIRQLEESFGQALALRQRGAGISPTPYGRMIMRKGRHLLELAGNLHDPHGDMPSGSVLIGCFTDISPYYLPALLQQLHQQHPTIQPSIVHGELDEIPQLLKRGEVDIAMTYGVLLDDELQHETLHEATPHALLAADHPLAEADSLTLERLLQEPFILSDSPYSSEFLLTVLASRGLEPRVAWNAGTFELLRGMVANGLGVSMAYTRPRCSRSYDGHELVYRPIIDPLPSQKIVLARHRDARLTPTTQVVWDTILADRVRQNTPD